MKTMTYSGLSRLGPTELCRFFALVVPLIVAVGCQVMHETVQTVQTRYHQYTDEPPSTTATPGSSNKVDTMVQSARDPVLALDKPPAIPAPLKPAPAPAQQHAERPHTATPTALSRPASVAKAEPASFTQPNSPTVAPASPPPPAKLASSDSTAHRAQPGVSQAGPVEHQAPALQTTDAPQALVVRGAPQPPSSIGARFPLLLVSGAMLAGMCSLVGWSFYKRQNPGPIAMGPEKDELLAAPGLFVKECASAREVIRKPEDSFSDKG